jgi:hypothetical protein
MLGQSRDAGSRSADGARIGKFRPRFNAIFAVRERLTGLAAQS